MTFPNWSVYRWCAPILRKLCLILSLMICSSGRLADNELAKNEEVETDSIVCGAVPNSASAPLFLPILVCYQALEIVGKTKQFHR